jgi:hypothetical protein
MKLLKKFMEWYRDEAVDPLEADKAEVSAIIDRAWKRNVEDTWIGERMSGLNKPWYRANFSHMVSDFVQKYFRKHGGYPTGEHYITEPKFRPWQFGEREPLKEPDKEKYSSG